MGNVGIQKKLKEADADDHEEKEAMIIGGNGTTKDGWNSAKRNSQSKYAPLNQDGEQHENEHSDSGPAILPHTQEVHLSKYIPKFKLPTSPQDLVRRMETQGLTLKEVTTNGCKIEGVIEVNEPEPNMEVVVRWSDNNWITYHETSAVLLQDNEGKEDHFVFVIESQEMVPSIKFALRCSTNYGAYWDNNQGQDYCFESIKVSA